MQKMQLDLPDRIREFELSCFEESAYSIEQIRSFLAHGGRAILETSCYALYRVLVDCIELDRIGVLPEFRRKGQAQQLIQRIVAEKSPVWVEVDFCNRAAVKLYESAGFQPVRIRKDYYGPGKNASVMVLHNDSSIENAVY